MRDIVQFLSAYIIVAYPGFCRCVCTFCFVCVFGGGGRGGVKLPLHPTKKKDHGSVRTAFVCTASYVTAIVAHYVRFSYVLLRPTT